MSEILAFSLTKLFSHVDNPDNLDGDGLILRTYYDGEEFNGRYPSELDTKNFLDSEIVYKGIIDESKIISKKQTPDEVFTELFVSEGAFS